MSTRRPQIDPDTAASVKALTEAIQPVTGGGLYQATLYRDQIRTLIIPNLIQTGWTLTSPTGNNMPVWLGSSSIGYIATIGLKTIGKVTKVGNQVVFDESFTSETGSCVRAKGMPKHTLFGQKNYFGLPHSSIDADHIFFVGKDGSYQTDRWLSKTAYANIPGRTTPQVEPEVQAALDYTAKTGEPAPLFNHLIYLDGYGAKYKEERAEVWDKIRAGLAKDIWDKTQSEQEFQVMIIGVISQFGVGGNVEITKDEQNKLNTVYGKEINHYPVLKMYVPAWSMWIRSIDRSWKKHQGALDLYSSFCTNAATPQMRAIIENKASALTEAMLPKLGHLTTTRNVSKDKDIPLPELETGKVETITFSEGVIVETPVVPVVPKINIPNPDDTLDDSIWEN